LELAEILLKHPNIKTDIKDSSGLTPGRYCNPRWYYDLAQSRDEKVSRRMKAYLGMLIQQAVLTGPRPLLTTNGTTGRPVASTQATSPTSPRQPPATRRDSFRLGNFPGLEKNAVETLEKLGELGEHG